MCSSFVHPKSAVSLVALVLPSRGQLAAFWPLVGHTACDGSCRDKSAGFLWPVQAWYFCSSQHRARATRVCHVHAVFMSEPEDEEGEVPHMLCQPVVYTLHFQHADFPLEF